MNKGININKRINAFFSVEAALVMPITIFIITLAVGLFVFQYDRCLLEQDMAAQTLRGAAAEAKTAEELTEKIHLQTTGLYRNKYVAWDIVMFEMKWRKGIIEAAGRGEFHFPFMGWNFWNRQNIWSTDAVYKAHRISPISFIRNCNKVKVQIETCK